jgi:hypothetical protein
MLTTGLQKQTVRTGHITVFDEVEIGLELHRIARLAEHLKVDTRMDEPLALAPSKIEQKLAWRLRLLGTQGRGGIALAAIELMLWDAWRPVTARRSYA